MKLETLPGYPSNSERRIATARLPTGTHKRAQASYLRTLVGQTRLCFYQTSNEAHFQQLLYQMIVGVAW